MQKAKSKVSRLVTSAATTALVRIHQSQFPQNVRRELLDCLRRRDINPRFHYESIKQATKWLKLHQTCSPSHRDKDCRATYQSALENTVSRLAPASKQIQVIGLGCGHGEKEAHLLRLLLNRGFSPSFTPVDVSLPLVLQAREAALPFLSGDDCVGLVCDLQNASGLPEVLDQMAAPGRPRLYTFFGVIPNSEPGLIFPQLARLVHPPDWLLLSANIAPGPDYQRGVQKVLPGYDNALTRDWLLTFLFDLGVEPGDGAVQFQIEQDRSGLKRITADFKFSKTGKIQVENRVFSFRRGETIRLFFSYRYTPPLIHSHLYRHGLQVLDQSITKSGEEGIFLCRRP